jgi:predicted DCC family thiol-disulfide oxidoreductase YuxK
MKDRPVILFDGFCKLCSWSVQFVLKRDKDKIFKYTPLQSEEGKNIQENYYDETVKTDSIILIYNERAFVKSDAVLEILNILGGFLKIFSVFRILPLRLRDAVYDLVAKYRYRIFGKRKECFLPETYLNDG